uniref:Helix-turn-helix domain-containing protein n=1 Tax=Leptobrachium leishanense TaxID=445787 RepID=A0A8C5LZ44_9ANUR
MGIQRDASNRPPLKKVVTDPSVNSIINLSGFNLLPRHFSLLQKGLSFVPTPHFNKFSWIKDLNLFARRLALHIFMEKKKEREAKNLGVSSEDYVHLENLLALLDECPPDSVNFSQKFKQKTKFTPSFSDFSNLEVFVNLVTSEIESIRNKDLKWESNLSQNEQLALNELQDVCNIVIKQSDKGGNLVIMDRNDYIAMCMLHLNDKDGYRKLESDPTLVFTKGLETLLTLGVQSKLISDDNHKFLLLKYPTIPTLYCLPKIHKSLISPPGRPIISGNNSLTERVSELVDCYLRPLVLDTPSYVRDTQHVLQKLSEIHVSPGTVLVSLDVITLYNNIPHLVGLQATKHFLSGKHSEQETEFVLSLLEYVLHHNYFLFQNHFYLQTRGTAMGTSCAPSYANLYLAWWEKLFVFSTEMMRFTNYVTKWLRYIDDILFLWQGPIEMLNEWLALLNNNEIGFGLTLVVGGNSIEFLDLNIIINSDLELITTLHRKPTSTNNFLNWSSHHPQNLKRGIPIGQYLRARRNCTSLQDFQLEANLLKNMFLSKGYPRKCLKRAYHRALSNLKG